MTAQEAAERAVSGTASALSAVRNLRATAGRGMAAELAGAESSLDRALSYLASVRTVVEADALRRGASV